MRGLAKDAAPATDPFGVPHRGLRGSGAPRELVPAPPRGRKGRVARVADNRASLCCRRENQQAEDLAGACSRERYVVWATVVSAIALGRCLPAAAAGGGASVKNVFCEEIVRHSVPRFDMTIFRCAFTGPLAPGPLGGGGPASLSVRSKSATRTVGLRRRAFRTLPSTTLPLNGAFHRSTCIWTIPF